MHKGGFGNDFYESISNLSFQNCLNSPRCPKSMLCFCNTCTLNCVFSPFGGQTKSVRYNSYSQVQLPIPFITADCSHSVLQLQPHQIQHELAGDAVRADRHGNSRGSHHATRRQPRPHHVDLVQTVFPALQQRGIGQCRLSAGLNSCSLAGSHIFSLGRLSSWLNTYFS